jgi:hypothetical protein
VLSALLRGQVWAMAIETTLLSSTPAAFVGRQVFRVGPQSLGDATPKVGRSCSF